MFRRLGKDKCLADRSSWSAKAKNGTGLTRLDQFNWVEEIGKIVEESHPDLFVGSFGINDRQGIVEKDRRAVAYPSPEFDARYSALVGEVLHAATSGGASMVIIGLPVMMEEDANADAQAKNKIFEAAMKQIGSDRRPMSSPGPQGARPTCSSPTCPTPRTVWC